MANKYLEFFNKTFKYLISVKTIIFARFCGGLYYEISSNKIINIAARVYCVVCSVVFYSHISNSFQSISLNINQFVSIACYYTCVVMSLVGFSETGSFLSELERVDGFFDVALDIDIPVTRILFLGVVLQRLTATTVWCTFTDYLCRQKYLNVIPQAFFMTTLMLSGFTRIMMFELTLHRMKALRSGLKGRLLASRQDESQVAREILQCMKIYKNLLSMFKNEYKAVKMMILLSVVFVVPKAAALVYMFHTNDYTLNIGVIVLDSIFECSLLLMPGVLASLINREVNEIKRLIVKQFFVCKGDATNYDLKEAIEDSLLYIEQRPYKFTVWRLFTVDMTMILGVVGLAITCCLATVQFGHFYG